MSSGCIDIHSKLACLRTSEHVAVGLQKRQSPISPGSNLSQSDRGIEPTISRTLNMYQPSNSNWLHVSNKDKSPASEPTHLPSPHIRQPVYQFIKQQPFWFPPRKELSYTHPLLHSPSDQTNQLTSRTIQVQVQAFAPLTVTAKSQCVSKPWQGFY